MDVIKEALLIEANGIRVNAMIVENLPKEFLYHKAKKLMPIEEYNERLVPAFTLDKNGKKVPTGEMVDDLNPGVKMDGAGSGGYLFDLYSDDSIQALKRIDKYIETIISDPALRPARVPYAQIPGDPNSSPKPYNTIVRVKLPVPASPPNVPTLEQDRPLPEIQPKKVKTPEQIAAMKARLEKARLAKANKATD